VCKHNTYLFGSAGAAAHAESSEGKRQEYGWGAMPRSDCDPSLWGDLPELAQVCCCCLEESCSRLQWCMGKQRQLRCALGSSLRWWRPCQTRVSSQLRVLWWGCSLHC
jgi:hypothetical protein